MITLEQLTTANTLAEERSRLLEIEKSVLASEKLEICGKSEIRGPMNSRYGYSSTDLPITHSTDALLELVRREVRARVAEIDTQLSALGVEP